MEQNTNNTKTFRARTSYALFSTVIVNTLYWFLWFLLCALLKDKELGKAVSTILMLALFGVLAGGYFYFQWRYEGKSKLAFSVGYFFWGMGVSLALCFIVGKALVMGKILLDELQLVVLFLFYVCSVFILIGVSVLAALAVFVKRNVKNQNWEKASAGFVAILLLLALALRVLLLSGH